MQSERDPAHAPDHHLAENAATTAAETARLLEAHREGLHTALTEIATEIEIETINAVKIGNNPTPHLHPPAREATTSLLVNRSQTPDQTTQHDQMPSQQGT